MCDICGKYPCDSRCPNAPEPELFGKCCMCGEKIFDGDTYYDIEGEYWCEDCIDESRKTAEVDYV